MSRKRVIDLCDSPVSSTPPQPLSKRQHRDSDTSSDGFFGHFPSDSPTNPFSRVKRRSLSELPNPTHVNEHLVLFVRLATVPHYVYRLVCVPPTYTFWHLSRLVQFLFGWKDYRMERDPHFRNKKVMRNVEHGFTVLKDVVMRQPTKDLGLIKSGRLVTRVFGGTRYSVEKSSGKSRIEREEVFTLQDVWDKHGSILELKRTPRGVCYNYDQFSEQKEVVHITLMREGAKLRNRALPEGHSLSNVPYVIQGSGLPDDDEDDEDFVLDLQQWNEPNAFLDYIHNKCMGAVTPENPDSPPSPIRIAEEQALVKRRMSGPLPVHLPFDDELEEGKENKAREVPAAPKKSKQRAIDANKDEDAAADTLHVPCASKRIFGISDLPCLLAQPSRPVAALSKPMQPAFEDLLDESDTNEEEDELYA